MKFHPVRVATYNVHAGIGLDHRYDASRIADVIDELAPDVIGLQEVRADHDGDLFAYLTDRFGGDAVEGPTTFGSDDRYGNLLLSRWPIVDFDVVDLAYPKREPRNAVQAVIDGPSGIFRVIATHFGLSRRERWIQAQLIASLIRQHDGSPLLVVGDFNDWPPLSRAGAAIRGALAQDLLGVRRLRTFPSFMPVFALDRILVHPARCLIESGRTGHA